jgi:hypothetical protein
VSLTLHPSNINSHSLHLSSSRTINPTSAQPSDINNFQRFIEQTFIEKERIKDSDVIGRGGKICLFGDCSGGRPLDKFFFFFRRSSHLGGTRSGRL